MKKTTITIFYDEEKLNALKIYLEQREMNTENELLKSLDILYSKNVPANVREFIELRSGVAPAPAKEKRKQSQVRKIRSSVSEVSANEAH